MEAIIGILWPIVAGFVGTGIVGFLIGKVPDSWLDKWVDKPVFAFFSYVTVKLNQVTGGLWNKSIEPLAKKIINRICINALKGLDSDNNKSKYGEIPKDV